MIKKMRGGERLPIKRKQKQKQINNMNLFVFIMKIKKLGIFMCKEDYEKPKSVSCREKKEGRRKNINVTGEKICIILLFLYSKSAYVTKLHVT